MKEKEELNNVFEALANEHRREIIYVLSFYPKSISQLARLRKLSLPAIHKHIKVLESANLILRKKSGRTNFLTLNKNTMLLLSNWILQFRAFWGNDSESLENYVAMIEKDE